MLSAGDVTSRDKSRGRCAPTTQPPGVCAVADDGVSGCGKATPGAWRRRAESGGEPRDHDDDVTTTTSGSYSVDAARELCSEIDDMFFAPGSTNV